MKLPLLFGTLCVASILHAQTSLRLSGSTTVRGALEPKQAALEAAIGRHIEFSGTGTSSGLLSLAAGGADAAMLSAPLEEVVEGINARTPGRLDASQYRSAQIGEVKIVFVVNPRNAVRTLSAGQITDLLTGKITNWKEVGGADAPVVVVSLVHGGPLIQEKLLHGQSITSTAKLVPSAPQIPIVVAADRNAIGIISSSHTRGQTSVVQTDATVVEPLFIATKGEPTAEAQKLIDTARQLLGAAPVEVATK